MARRKRSGRNKRPRRMRRNVRRRTLSAAPPRLSLSANTRRLVIPYATNLSDTTFNFFTSLNINALLSYSPNLGFALAYSEIKLHRVRVWFQSDYGTNTTGSIVLVVADSHEMLQSKEFDELCTYPGAMVRKIWQNVSGQWYPTEPSDREWISVKDSANEMINIIVCSSSTSAKLSGRLIAHCDVSFRGRNSKAAVLNRVEGLRATISHEGFEHMSLADCEPPAL